MDHPHRHRPNGKHMRKSAARHGNCDRMGPRRRSGLIACGPRSTASAYDRIAEQAEQYPWMPWVESNWQFSPAKTRQSMAMGVFACGFA